MKIMDTHAHTGAGPPVEDLAEHWNLADTCAVCWAFLAAHSLPSAHLEKMLDSKKTSAEDREAAQAMLPKVGV